MEFNRDLIDLKKSIRRKSIRTLGLLTTHLVETDNRSVFNLYEAGWTINFLNFGPVFLFRGCDSAKTLNEQTFSLASLMGAASCPKRNFRLSKLSNGYIFDSRKFRLRHDAALLSEARENVCSLSVLAESQPANRKTGVNIIFFRLFVRSKLCVRSFFSYLKDRSRILFSNFFIVKT